MKPYIQYTLLTLTVVCLLLAVSLTLAVVGSCEFLQGHVVTNHDNNTNTTIDNHDDNDNDDVGNLRLGVYRYSLNDPSHALDTGGACHDYADWFQQEDLDWTVRIAQLASILTAVAGLTLLWHVMMTQCCCSLLPRVCTSILVTLLYSTVFCGTALIWLLKTNDICNTLRGGCTWGPAAHMNLVAHIFYTAAALVHACLPNAAHERQIRREAKQAAEAAVASSQHNSNSNSAHNTGDIENNNNTSTTTAGGPAAVVVTASTSLEMLQHLQQQVQDMQQESMRRVNALEEQVQRQQQILDKQQQQQQALRQQSTKGTGHESTRTTTTTTDPTAATWQDMEMELEHQKAALVAATTAAAAAATQIQALQHEKEQILRNAQHDVQEYQAKVQALEHDHVQQTLTIQQLQDELEALLQNDPSRRRRSSEQDDNMVRPEDDADQIFVSTMQIPVESMVQEEKDITAVVTETKQPMERNEELDSLFYSTQQDDNGDKE